LFSHGLLEFRDKRQMSVEARTLHAELTDELTKVSKAAGIPALIGAGLMVLSKETPQT
jgi:hypothetical protein